MKRILWILGFCVIVMRRVTAQEVTYWVGQSANPDPIIRHHEAFMNAFIQYIQNRSMRRPYNSVTNGNESPNKQSCRIETVSSVTHEGRETLTISMGSGLLVDYKYLSESSSTENTTQTETILRITYQDESGSQATASEHVYSR